MVPTALAAFCFSIQMADEALKSSSTSRSTASSTGMALEDVSPVKELSWLATQGVRSMFTFEYGYVHVSSNTCSSCLRLLMIAGITCGRYEENSSPKTSAIISKVIKLHSDNLGFPA